jgi:hypothetical protein
MRQVLCILCLLAVFFAGCGNEPVTTGELPLEDGSLTEDLYPGLSVQAVETLSSLEMVDGYPLYVMRYSGGYGQIASIRREYVLQVNSLETGYSWACTMFAALADKDNRLFGRNFDWEYSPALLLFTDPPGGYASVSIVDIAYLGFAGSRATGLDELPLTELITLLDAPWLPFDGMNEHGLVVGMAAVPPGDMPQDAAKQTLDSLEIIRKILDEARDVDEALEIMDSYNIAWAGGPALHYLIADRSGRAVLVEFYAGEMHVTPNDTPWHLATNFLCAAVEGSLAGNCWRYDRVLQEMETTGGYLRVDEVITLLSEVSQANTQWSVVYGINTGSVEIVIGQNYDQVHSFQFDLADP